MARLQMEWQEPSVGSYEGYDPANLFTGLPDELGESGMPLLVYLASDLGEHADESDLVQSTVLADEKVALGLKMFKAVKIDGARITKEHPFEDILGGRELPRMVVVGADGTKVGSVEGKISPSRVFSLMKRASSKVYKTQIDSYIKEYQKVLTEIDKVEAAKAVIATQRATSGDVSKGKAAKWDRDEAELAEKETSLLEKEKELLAFRLRDGGKLVTASSSP